MEARAAVTHVSIMSPHNSKSFRQPVTSYDRKQVKAVPNKPVYTVGSTTWSLRFQVSSTTCSYGTYTQIISQLLRFMFNTRIASRSIYIIKQKPKEKIWMNQAHTLSLSEIAALKNVSLGSERTLFATVWLMFSVIKSEGSCLLSSLPPSTTEDVIASETKEWSEVFLAIMNWQQII